MAEYDFEIIYQPGKTNVVADALTRSPNVQLQAIMQVKPDKRILNAIKKNLSEDKAFGKIFQILRKEGQITSEEKVQIQEYTIHEDLLLYKKVRICVPKIDQVRTQIL